jgi:hypothetical protein
MLFMRTSAVRIARIQRAGSPALRNCPVRLLSYPAATMAGRHSGQTRGSGQACRITGARGKSFRTIGGEPMRVQGLMMKVTLSAALRQTSTRFPKHARLAQGVVRSASRSVKSGVPEPT